MALRNWDKIENEDGYPCYVNQSTGEQNYDHPRFIEILNSLLEFDGIKYSTYLIAFKIFHIQKYLRVPPLRITLGVFSRHQLSLSESTLSLDTAELEAVLADIYFAAEKEGLFSGDIDLAVNLMINLLLNVYDRHRKEPVRVLAAKTLLIILSEESASEKWLALSECCADHNGCVTPKRLSALVAHISALPVYLGEKCDNLQNNIDSCFSKNAGMLGIPLHSVASWGVNCANARWLPTVQRIVDSRNISHASHSCCGCSQQLIQVLKFKCSKCPEVYLCEKCYLYDKDLSIINGHKKTHVVLEIIDGDNKTSECMSFMKGMKRFFFCTKTKKKKTNKRPTKKSQERQESHPSLNKKQEIKPTMFTSTVGKASGNGSHPSSMLQDIISQLESQNKALRDLSSQLQAAKDADDSLRIKVDTHWTQISTQIHRLKILKDNLESSPQSQPSTSETGEKSDRPQAFDLFSPIPVLDEKQSKVPDLKSQPRVLSLDSGNFSVASRPDQSGNLLTVSGDALKPVLHLNADSISTVSVNDISTWYNETENLPQSNKNNKTIERLHCNQSISATEQKYAADIKSVETSNDKMKELNADLDTVLDRLHQILANNFAMDDTCFDNSQLRETANEMEGLLGTLIRGVEQRATCNANKGMV